MMGPIFDGEDDKSMMMQNQQVNFGELLFPSFNTIVPLLLEFTPQLDSHLIKVLTQTVYFAFKT